MAPLMLEIIAGDARADEALVKEVREYIDPSAGIQTYHQMKWLSESDSRYGRNHGASTDPLWYKTEYNLRLMKQIEMRKSRIQRGEKSPSEYLVKGSRELLEAASWPIWPLP